MNSRAKSLVFTWQSLIALTLIFIAFETPLAIALKYQIGLAHLFFDIFSSLLLICDYILRRSYFKQTNTSPLDHHREPRFSLIDFLALIPYDLIIFLVLSLTKTPYSPLWHAFSLLKLARLYRFYEFLRGLYLIPRPLKISVIVITFVMTVHWIGCGWILINLNNDAPFTLYNKAIYWAITTLTTIGYGDIVPTTNLTRFYTMAIMILGVGLYGLVIANVSQAIASANRYKEETKQRIHDLTLFLKHYQVPHKIQQNVFQYYSHLVQKRLSQNDDSLISNLPQVLQKDLRMYMNIKLIGNVPVFHEADPQVLREIAQDLEEVHVAPGDKVVKRGDPGLAMFIISDGAVHVLDKHQRLIAELETGQHFGEMSLLKETNRNHDVVATDYCVLYRFDKDPFFKVLKKYPKLKESFERIIQQRKANGR